MKVTPKVPTAVVIKEKRAWYVVDGLHYLGPYASRAEAEAARKFHWKDSSGCPRGMIEQLDAEAAAPTFGLHGPLKPRYP